MVTKTKTVIYSGGSSKSQQSIGFKTDKSTGATKSTHLTATKPKTTTVTQSYGYTKSASGKDSGSTSRTSGGYRYGGSYGGGSSKMEPTKAFEFDGIEFWGSAKTNLEKFGFQEGDLIINCTGMSITFKPFIKKMPDFISIGSVTDQKPDELLLDWPDFKSPPLHISMDFWRGVITSAKENGVKRIFCCCMAGQGRTGTALSSLVMATGAITHHERAIAFIRYEYSSHAVESSVQEQYLEALAMSAGTLKFESVEDRAEYEKQFLDEFYGTEEKIDLAEFLGRPFDDIIDALKERDGASSVEV